MWVVEVLKEFGKFVVVIMCIGSEGDMRDVFFGECVAKLVRVGDWYL